MKYALFFAFPVLLAADTLTLVNNSSYILNAQIISAQSQFLSKTTIGPQDQFIWEDPYGGQTMGQATAPYTIIWTCDAGDYYGTTYEVAAGSTSSAQDANGPRVCTGQAPNYNP